MTRPSLSPLVDASSGRPADSCFFPAWGIFLWMRFDRGKQLIDHEYVPE